jgi:hypothetical protein
VTKLPQAAIALGGPVTHISGGKIMNNTEETMEQRALKHYRAKDKSLGKFAAGTIGEIGVVGFAVAFARIEIRTLTDVMMPFVPPELRPSLMAKIAELDNPKSKAGK